MRRSVAVLTLCLSLLAACSSTATEQARRAPTEQSTTPTAPSSPPATTEVDSALPSPGEASPSENRGDVLPDSLYPDLGSAAIDVQSYDVDLAFDPADRQLRATVVMAIVAAADLSTIELDANGPVLDRAEVDGRSATFAQRGAKLEITPQATIGRGETFTLEFAYHHDTTINEATPGLGPGSTGWFNTPDGAYVLNEPDGTSTYLPANDHPSDKATWEITLRVPAGLTGVANGALVNHETAAGGEVYTWRESAPMATYLLQILIGKYTIIEDQVPGGPKLVSAILTKDAARLTPCLESMAPQIEFFEQYFGPYPFEQYGMALTDSFSGLAMETQGRSLYSADDMHGCPDGPGPVMAHELAHQWFGDAVTLAQWKDIWLNESFATYGQWMWSSGGTNVDSLAATGLRMRGRSPTGDPDIDQMFGINSYDGGAVVLHALRRIVGDDTFFRILRRWAADNFGQSRTTADFIALCEAESAEQLDDFFDTWLFSATVPAAYPAPAS